MTPNRWQTAKLIDVAELIMGQSPRSEDCNDDGLGMPFFQGNAEFGSKHPIPRRWIEAPSKIAQAGDILMSVRAPVGELNIADTTCCIGRGLMAIRPSSDSRGYVYQWLQFAKRSWGTIAQGSTFEAVNRKQVEELEVAVEFPDMGEDSSLELTTLSSRQER